MSQSAPLYMSSHFNEYDTTMNINGEKVIDNVYVSKNTCAIIIITYLICVIMLIASVIIISILYK